MSGGDEVETVQLPMVCTCSPEGAQAAAELRARVTERLSEGSRVLRARPVTDAGFLSAVCLSLNADFQAHVAGIFMDQWFLVVVEQLLPSNEERRVVVQADAAEDGLAAVWEWLSQA
ncbi:hypothetical protein RKE38_10390 [Phycicoccus sp. M110.8]|uniref:hypothetical protein n=1 Tax=Phycicoccus sp. M110.8 TaxID=3075433 RepID=UPI0028FD2E07|nr:hypothetical protein [Phycicoccus sp. M110.8]MDU0314093.1 hypothetical protein [Phycicoccus sp. M110.8]